MIRLIGIDVDGTLVGTDGTVHPSVWPAAKRACAAGIHLALCSGRPAFGIALEYARRLDPVGWHVFQNGASIVCLADEQSRSVTLPADAVAALIAVARRTADVLELYSDNDYVTESTSAWAKDHAALLGVPFHARVFESLSGAVVRAQWLLSPQDAERITASDYPELEIAESTSPVMSDTTFVGLTRAGVSKGAAIRAIAAEYGVAMQDIMYIGDSGNDLSALRVVGCPIAMANADPEVRELAKRTVGHVDDGGVAQALELALSGTV